MFRHTIYTWLLAVLLHSILIIVLMYGDTDAEGGWSFIVTTAILLFIYTLPAMIICWLLLGLIIHSFRSRLTKFLVWLFTVPVLIFSLFIAACFLFGSLNETDLAIFVPAIISFLLAIICRYSQFEQLFSSTQTDDHENNLV